MKTLIKNGRVIDPAQNIDTRANLLAVDGAIVAITDEEPRADLVIDAKGRAVVPGFIDIHMHEDPFDEESGELLRDTSEAMLRMGVTTCAGGNCGSNKADPGRVLDYIDAHGNPVSLALFAGHTFLRESCGFTDIYAPADEETVKRMEELARSYLDKGCIGISFGPQYIPGMSFEEIERLAALCVPSGRLAASHIRYDVDRVFEAAREMYEAAKRTGCRVQISHIGSMGGYGQMERLLRDIEGYRAEGADIMCDCYPYTAFSTSIGSAVYDPDSFAAYGSDYSRIMMATGRHAGQFCTKEIFDWERKNAPDDLTVAFLMKEEDVELALAHPLVMLGSDGVLRGRQGHPRAAGTFPRFIAEYIRKGRVGLMEGLAKMTCMPAERLRLPRKGSFRPGSDADIVIFDLENIRDRASFAEPSLPPTGIDWVLIGGRPALKDGEIVDGTLGRAVRYEG